MDTEKWKSVLVPRDVYLEIKKTAQDEGRTIGGMLRVAWQSYQREQQKSDS